MLRIIGRENYRETLLVSGESERAAEALSRHLGVYLGTNPGSTAVRSTILRLL